jgi:hypothetical protein
MVSASLPSVCQLSGVSGDFWNSNVFTFTKNGSLPASQENTTSIGLSISKNTTPGKTHWQENISLNVIDVKKKIQLIQEMNPKWDDLYEGLGG